MSYNNRFHRDLETIKQLKSEYGATSSEAFEVVKLQRRLRSFARMAKQLTSLDAEPTVKLTGIICEATDLLTPVLASRAMYDVSAETGWVMPQDMMLHLVTPWCRQILRNGRPGKLKINYPAIVGGVFWALQNLGGSDAIRNDDKKLSALIRTTVFSLPIVRHRRSSHWLTWDELVGWYRRRPGKFVTPTDSDYVKVARQEISAINRVEKLTLTHLESNPAATQQFHDMFGRSTVDENVTEQFRELARNESRKRSGFLEFGYLNLTTTECPTLLHLFKSERLYDRAERELSLKSLWVSRQIAMTAIFADNPCIGRNSPAKEIDSAITNLETYIELCIDEREEIPEDPQDETWQDLKKYRYILQSIRRNRSWLEQFLAS